QSAPAPGRQYALKSSAARVQTVPSVHARTQIRVRVARSSSAGSDQIKPQMLYPIFPQPYGSGFSMNGKREFYRNYGRPNGEFSGADSGGTWERLVFVGIDFRFEN